MLIYSFPCLDLLKLCGEYGYIYIYSCSFLYIFMLLWHRWKSVHSKMTDQFPVFFVFLFFPHSSCNSNLRESLHATVGKGAVGTGSPSQWSDWTEKVSATFQWYLKKIIFFLIRCPHKCKQFLFIFFPAYFWNLMYRQSQHIFMLLQRPREMLWEHI